MFSSLGIALMTINSLIIFRIVLGMQVENCSKRGRRSLHSLRAKGLNWSSFTYEASVLLLNYI